MSATGHELLARARGRTALGRGLARDLVRSTLLTLHPASAPAPPDRLTPSSAHALHQRLLGARPGCAVPRKSIRRGRDLEQCRVGRYVTVRRIVREEHRFRQTRRGRPGPQSTHRKLPRRRFDIQWTLDEKAIA
ncbi:MAG: hypothetical protein IPH83_21195 [Gammaproteobacteria bacterium]|nr:hypothetical protein [Gammaproteobacteria bacterium]